MLQQYQLNERVRLRFGSLGHVRARTLVKPYLYDVYLDNGEMRLHIPHKDLEPASGQETVEKGR